MRISDDDVLWSVPEPERTGRPLLVLLHGHGMTERVGFELRDRLPGELVVAAVRGPVRVGAGYGWFPLDASLTLAQVDAAAHALLDWLDRQSGHSSVGLLGFSQGSAIALHCLRLRPEAFAYVVVLSGFLVPAALPGDAQLVTLRPPVFAARGTADPLVPQFLVILTDQWLAEHTAVSSHRYPGLGHNVSEAELVDLATFLRARLGEATVSDAF